MTENDGKPGRPRAIRGGQVGAADAGRAHPHPAFVRPDWNGLDVVPDLDLAEFFYDNCLHGGLSIPIGGPLRMSVAMTSAPSSARRTACAPLTAARARDETTLPSSLPIAPPPIGDARGTSLREACSSGS